MACSDPSLPFHNNTDFDRIEICSGIPSLVESLRLGNEHKVCTRL